MDTQLLDIIKKATDKIYDNFRYYTPRIGKIEDVTDPIKKGRVLVTIPSLGWVTKDQGAWCYPKEKKSIKTPKVEDYVLVEWIDANRDMPIYSGVAYNMANMLPKGYDGKSTTDIIYEDNLSTTTIKYDSEKKELSVQDGSGNKITMSVTSLELKGAFIKMNEGTDAFLKGTTFDAWLTGFITGFNSHTHSGVMPGPGLTAGPNLTVLAPTNHLSTKIKGE